LLELAEVALDAIAFLVEIEVVGPLKLAIALRRNDDVGAVGSDPVYEVIGVLSLVGDGGFGLDAVDQITGEGDVVALTRRGNQANGRASASVAAWIWCSGRRWTGPGHGHPPPFNLARAGVDPSN
jgi:hypothetical protein